MIFSNELFEKARDILDVRRANAEAENNRRLMEFEKTEPRYRALKKEMIDSVRVAMETFGADKVTTERVIKAQKERNLAAQKEIGELLLAHNLPQDYLEIHYTCPLCGDTGAVGTRLCSCFEELLKTLAFEEANKRSPLRVSSFEDFRLDYYSDETVPQYKCSPRERMTQNLALCREYAETFDLNSNNLYLCGATGLGKTHLSLAIAGEVVKKGYTVIYNSAQNIFNEMQKEYFGREKTRQFETLVLECDLLIMDDLGAEFKSTFSEAALYNIINTRLNLRLPTIINSNYLPRQTEEAYSQRISSRLIGDYVCVMFFGNDIRQMKNDE